MKKSYLNFFLLNCAMLCAAWNANAMSVYDNNMSALNINALTDTFMSYTNYGEKMSDFFNREKLPVYGTMTRVDEYGDDGSTLKTLNTKESETTDMFIRDVWANANHFNAHMHYGKNINEHGRFNLATIGATTKSLELKHGTISFGGFASYMNNKISDTKSGGDFVGIFSHYKYRNFGARTLTNIGSINNTVANTDYNNSWINVATDAYAKIKLDDTFLMRPSVYIGYTWVSSDDLFVNGARVLTSDYNFINVAPGIEFIKQISKNWYGTLSGKYVAHFGGDNHIHVDSTTIDGIELDNHTDIGLDVEYDWKHFAFTGRVHKLLGGIDGWDSNINVKYVF